MRRAGSFMRPPASARIRCCCDSGDGIQWGDTVDGQTLEEYARDQALESAALYATVENWAEDYACTLTDEDRTAMDREWAARSSSVSVQA